MPLKSPAPLPKPSMNAGIVAALIVASLTILFSAWYLSGDTKALTTREGTQVSSEAHANALPPPVEKAPALNRPGSSSTQPTLILGIEPNAANQGQLLRMLQKKIAASTPVEEIRALLESIAMSDPALAVDLALGIARTDAQKTVFASGVLQGWVRKDPEAAWRWTLHESRRLDSPDEPTFLSVTLDYPSEMQPHMVVSAVEAALQPGGKPDSLDARQLTQNAVQAMIRSRHTKMA